MKRLLAALLLKEVPILSNFLKWFFSPDMVARKRTIIVFLIAMAGGLKASIPLFGFVCEGAESVLCKVDLGYVAQTIVQFTDLLNTPEMGGVAFITGLYAIFSGYKKAKK